MLPLDLKFHHVGIACRNIIQTRAFYEAMGYVAGDVVDDEVQRVRICLLTHPTAPLLELVEPLDDDSPVVRTLNATGVTPYHICYETRDIDAAITAMRHEHRFVLVARPVPACALGDRRVAFLYQPDTGLVELLQSN